MWTRDVDGRPLTFHLAGINNQNFLMRDEETGSFWQQINGKAISGRLKGRQLTLVRNDELTFALWHKENPSGMVLKPVAKYVPEYERKDWEKRMARAPSVIDTKSSGHAPRELMLGIELAGASRAFPWDRVIAEKLVQDHVGTQPVLLVTGPDEKSVRIFAGTIPGIPGNPDFYREVTPAGAGFSMMDSLSGSRWDFKGCAVSGPAAGKCLMPVVAVKDYWFDWRNYHPDTTVYHR